MTKYHYLAAEPTGYVVGHWRGKWYPESDHEDLVSAIQRRLRKNRIAVCLNALARQEYR